MITATERTTVFAGDLFAEKVFVVTGGGQGIGKAISDYLRFLSATVVVLEHPALAEHIAPVNTRFIDLSDQKALQSCIAQIVNQYGRCDGLINNARAGQRTAPLQETAENIANSIAVGLTAPALLSQQFIAYAAGLPHSGRSIINISSTAGKHISAESGSYHATKAALENLTKYLAVYAGAHHVRVNAIAPGFIVKEEHHKRFTSEDNTVYRQKALAAHPLERVGTVNDIATTAAFLLSDAAAFITGQTLVVDGGLTLKDGFASLMSVNTQQENMP